MPLLTVVIIINTSKTVLIIYLIIISKAKQVFKEMYNFINKFIFYNIPILKVYISDQGAGFILTTKKLIQEDIQIQLYKWHVVKNIKTILVNSGKYLKEKWKTLKDLIQVYTKLESPAKLKANYNTLMHQLNQLKAFKIKDHQGLREAYFNRAYTYYYYNLGTNTLQRGESIHLIIKARLYKDLILPEVVNQIKLVINKKFKEYKRLKYKNYKNFFQL